MCVPSIRFAFYSFQVIYYVLSHWSLTRASWGKQISSKPENGNALLANIFPKNFPQMAYDYSESNCLEERCMESHFQRIQSPPIPELHHSQTELEGEQTGPLNTQGGLGLLKRSGLMLEGEAGAEQATAKHLSVVTNHVITQVIEWVYRWVLGEEQTTFGLHRFQGSCVPFPFY